MPPEVVSQILRAALDLPLAQTFKTFRIHHEDAAGPVSRGGTQRAAENSLGTAVDSVRPAVSSSFGEHVRLNHLDDLRLPRIGFRIHDMNPRGFDPRHNQVAPFRMWMRHVRA